MLCNQSEQDKKKLREEITDWQALVIDTYEEVKKETTQKPNTEERKEKFPLFERAKTIENVENDKVKRMFSERGSNPYLKEADALRDGSES